MDDLLHEFLTESHEILTRLDNEIVELERQPQELALVHCIFRTVHTIKGTCGFFGLPRLESVAHATENVLGLVRDGRLPVSAPLISDVLRAVDAIRRILASLERFGEEAPGDDSGLIEALEHWIVHASPVVVEGAHGHEARFRPDQGSGVLHHPSVAEGGSGPCDALGDQALVDRTLRVDVRLLDTLMDLVGELARARDELTQLAAAEKQSASAASLQHLHRVTTALQAAVTRTRIQPIGHVWTTLPRLVRDLASASGKQIHLVMSGAETEVDRQILRALRDPLTHMVRNAVDHGVEQPEVRRAVGKPLQGTIRLDAFREGEHVILEIADDGVGIPVGRVRAKAVERGLVNAADAARLPDARVLRFILEPGLSTASHVTSLSGRGVGMDVVRRNIEQVGGTIELHSEPGIGTTTRLRIPLTLGAARAGGSEARRPCCEGPP